VDSLVTQVKEFYEEKAKNPLSEIDITQAFLKGPLCSLDPQNSLI